MSSFSILVVDDEPENFNVIEALLSIDTIQLEGNRNYQLYYAADGETAISILDVCRPDLILLDIMMPGIDGVEVCQQIKGLSKWKMIPIIMVTAITTRSELARCLSAGANDFINKPINAVELKARVHSMLTFKEHYDRLNLLCQVQEQTIDELHHRLNKVITNSNAFGEASNETLH